jgi:membrane-anchored protein YejM (alkaline phosphatase superfamily)
MRIIITEHQSKLLTRIINEENNYFKVFDKNGDIVWVGKVDKGSEKEKELIDKLFDNEYKLKPISKEEFNDFDFKGNVIKYIKSKMGKLNRESYERGSASWFNKEGKEMLQYHNRFFLVNRNLYYEVQEKFGTHREETNSIFSKYFDKKYPNLRHFGIAPL